MIPGLVPALVAGSGGQKILPYCYIPKDHFCYSPLKESRYTSLVSRGRGPVPAGGAAPRQHLVGRGRRGRGEGGHRGGGQRGHQQGVQVTRGGDQCDHGVHAPVQGALPAHGALQLPGPGGRGRGGRGGGAGGQRQVIRRHYLPTSTHTTYTCVDTTLTRATCG